MASFFQRHACSRMLILALFAIFCSAAQAQGQGQFNISVNPNQGGHRTWTISVNPFQLTGGQPVSPSLDKTIMNDLSLSGLFNPPQNTQFAQQIHQVDQAKGAIQFAEWTSIGVLYVLDGTYQTDGSMITVSFKLYDAAGAKYMFGRLYERKFSASDARRQAHRIADDIIQQITGEEGIANTQICYVRNNDPYGNSKQVCVTDADGSNAHAVIPGGALVATPCWGANGTEIYYTTWRDFNPDLEGVILRTGKRWWISRFVNLNLSPDWSEKNQEIALTLSKDGNPEIYTMGRNGLNVKRLTNNRSIDGSPCWSPDGSEICYTSDRSGSKQLYIMNVNSGQERRLTYSGSDNDGASWGNGASRETRKIAFMSLIDGVYQICTINPDGTDQRQLTSGSRNEDPSWAPNGRVLVFTSNRSGESQLFSMYADGANQHQLTTGLPSHSARWSPAMQ